MASMWATKLTPMQTCNPRRYSKEARNTPKWWFKISPRNSTAMLPNKMFRVILADNEDG